MIVFGPGANKKNHGAHYHARSRCQTAGSPERVRVVDEVGESADFTVGDPDVRRRVSA